MDIDGSMQKSERIVLGTSLAPFNLMEQRRNVVSWIDNSFKVVSFNAKEERELIEPYFNDLDIEFVTLNRDSEAVSGKKMPFIQDVLAGAAERAEFTCGFINSDIFLDKIDVQMNDFLAEQSQNSLVFLRRCEIDKIEDIYSLSWKVHFDGFDMFLVDCNLASDLFDDGFFVQSSWCYCLLIKAVMKGASVKELKNPICFHIKHAQKWNFEMTNYLAQQFCKKYFADENDAYRYVKNCYYQILYNECESICYLKQNDYKCSFIVENINNSVLKVIEKQNLENLVVFEKKDGLCIRDYDFVFFLDQEIELNKEFCRTAIYILSHFHHSDLDIMSFFVSDIGGKTMYNELNRNMEILDEINQNHLIHVSQKKVARKESKKIFWPLVNVKIDIEEKHYVKKITVPEQIFIMPAGIRANEWLKLYKKELGDVDFIGFLDNKKKGRTSDGNRIFPVSEISKHKKAKVIVATKYYRAEIMRQICEMIGCERVLEAGFMLKISNGEIYLLDYERYKLEQREKL